MNVKELKDFLKKVPDDYTVELTTPDSDSNYDIVNITVENVIFHDTDEKLVNDVNRITLFGA
jgi:hypothetical protein